MPIKNKNLCSVFGVALICCGVLFLFSNDFGNGVLNFSSDFFHKTLNQNFWLSGIQNIGFDFIVMGALAIIHIWYYDILKKRFLFLASTILVFRFYYIVTNYLVNLPLADDYEAILNFLNHFYSATTITEKLSALSSPYYETRLVFIKTIALLCTMITGKMNFSIVLFISSLFIFGISVMLFKAIRLNNDKKYFLLLPLMILFLQFQYHSGIFFVIGGMPKFCTIFFSMCAFYFLSRGKTKFFIGGLICALFAALCFGNGALCLLIGLLILLHQRKFLLASIWGIIIIFFFIWYFSGFSFHPTVNSSSIWMFFLFGLIFLGNSMQFFYHLWFPMAVGIIIWLVTIYLTYKKYYKKNIVVHSTLLFIVLSSLLPAAFRTTGDIFELHYALMTHYGIYSMTAICCCVIAMIELSGEIKRKSIIKSFFVTAIVYRLMSDILFFPELKMRKDNELQCNYPWLKNNPQAPPPICTYDKIPENGSSIVYTSMSLGIYQLPESENKSKEK